jgi:hypothetical protein
LFYYFHIITDTTESRNHLCKLTGKSPSSFEPSKKKRQKPQISSSPGVSPRDRHRYRVTLGEEILGDRLTITETLKLADISAKGVK